MWVFLFVVFGSVCTTPMLCLSFFATPHLFSIEHATRAMGKKKKKQKMTKSEPGAKGAEDAAAIKDEETGVREPEDKGNREGQGDEGEGRGGGKDKEEESFVGGGREDKKDETKEEEEQLATPAIEAGKDKTKPQVPEEESKGQQAECKNVEELIGLAEQGNASAQCNLGNAYDEGEGVAKKPKEAVK